MRVEGRGKPRTAAAPTMKVLLVYPSFPNTFWSFHYALEFIGRTSSFPPLGLLTVAAMLPEMWEKRVVDLNVRPLRERDLAWADCVFVSAMAVRRQSACEVLARSRAAGALVSRVAERYTGGNRSVIIGAGPPGSLVTARLAME